MMKLSLVLVVVASACKAKEAPPPPPSEKPQANMSGAMPRKMANCPSAVPNAVSKIVMTADGVDLSVTSTDPETERKIVERASFHMMHANVTPGKEHTGMRGGPARIGYCPSVHPTATVTSTPITGGVMLHMAARTPEQVKELQEVTKARAERMPGFISS